MGKGQGLAPLLREIPLETHATWKAKPVLSGVKDQYLCHRALLAGCGAPVGSSQPASGPHRAPRQAACGKDAGTVFSTLLAGCSNVTIAGALFLPPTSQTLTLHTLPIRHSGLRFYSPTFGVNPTPTGHSSLRCRLRWTLPVCPRVTPEASACPCSLSSTWAGVLCYQTFNKCYF